MKDIPGMIGLYRASVYGEIKSIRNNVVLKQRKDNRPGMGYMKVNISIYGEVKTYLVHRLIALAYLPNPENKPTVNHKNGIKTDNNVDNLEWATWSEQIIHAQTTGLKPLPTVPVWTKETNPNNKRVLHVDDKGKLIKEYLSVEIAAAELNVKPKSLANVCRGYRTNVFGNYFKYAI